MDGSIDGPRRAPTRRPLVGFAVVAAVVVALAVVGGSVALVVGVSGRTSPEAVAATPTKGSPSPAPKLPVVGGCADRVDGRHHGVPCTSQDAEVHLLAMLATTESVEQQGLTTQACPAATDEGAVERVDGRLVVLCVRYLSGEHPGDPGRGGGALRVGDCVPPDNELALEISCADKEAAHRVVARVKARQQCPRVAFRWRDIQTSATPVLCLGDGPHTATEGECVSDPEAWAFDPLASVPCDRQGAKAVVLSRRGSAEDCEAIMTHYYVDPAGLPGRQVVCVRRTTD